MMPNDRGGRIAGGVVIWIVVVVIVPSTTAATLKAGPVAEATRGHEEQDHGSGGDEAEHERVHERCGVVRRDGESCRWSQ